MLCDHAVDVADAAAGLVATENDVDTGPGGRLSQASQLIELAERALASAVVFERARTCRPSRSGERADLPVNAEKPRTIRCGAFPQ
ncbi:hypothetical protein GCM10010493_60010 [Streptomyces lavendulae subsp. grasserius]